MSFGVRGSRDENAGYGLGLGGLEDLGLRASSG